MHNNRRARRIGEAIGWCQSNGNFGKAVLTGCMTGCNTNEAMANG